MNVATLRDEINAALKRLPEAGNFSFVSPVAFDSITRRIAERFLQRGVLDLEHAWWWEHIRGESYVLAPAEPLVVVESLLNKKEEYWLIASEECSGPKWLCEAEGSRIVDVLREMHHFEYYIVQKKLDWLLGENHHGMVFAAGDDMPLQLKQIGITLNSTGTPHGSCQ